MNKSFSIPPDYEQFRSNSLPTTAYNSNVNSPYTGYNSNNNMNSSSPFNNSTTTTTTTTAYNNNNNSAFSNTTTAATTTDTTNPASCDLQDVIYYYQSQPELLRLILLSKVEEDKRKAEEAKLRAKELDMFLLQQQPGTPDMYNTATSTSNSTGSFKRPSVLDLLMDDSDTRRDSALGSSFDTQSDDMDTASTTPSMLSMRYARIYKCCSTLLLMFIEM
jgi:hypothetical protein